MNNKDKNKVNELLNKVRKLLGREQYQSFEGSDIPTRQGPAQPGRLVPTGFGAFRSDASRIAEYATLEGMRRYGDKNVPGMFDTVDSIYQRYGRGRSNLEQLLLDIEGQSRDGAAFTGYKRGLPLTRSGNIDFDAIEKFLDEQEKVNAMNEMIRIANRTRIPGVEVIGKPR